LSQRYERGSTPVTSNLPFQEWTEVLGSERLTGVAAGSTHPPRPHPGDERRRLPPETEQTQARLNAERLILPTTFHQTLRGGWRLPLRSGVCRGRSKVDHCGGAKIELQACHFLYLTCGLVV